MPDSRIIGLARANKAAILAQEEDAMREMVKRWLQIEQAVRDDLEILALKAAQMKANGQVVNQAIALRMDRMTRVLYQVRAETGKYAQWAEDLITDHQIKLALQGLEHATAAILTTMDEYGISVAFDRLNIGAIENMIGFAADGSPLARYLQDVHGSAANGMLDALVNGIAQGMNSQKIAQNMADGLGIGLQKAMNTARTETLRSYRTATLMQYDASGIVAGYKRVSARDAEVCAGCLFTDGQYYEDLTQFDEHNQGRCSPVPVLKGIPEPTWESGAEWFETQSPAVQERILGSGRFEAWKNGTPLEAMVKRVNNPIWGGAFVPTPVGELQVSD